MPLKLYVVQLQLGPKLFLVILLLNFWLISSLVHYGCVPEWLLLFSIFHHLPHIHFQQKTLPLTLIDWEHDFQHLFLWPQHSPCFLLQNSFFLFQRSVLTLLQGNHGCAVNLISFHFSSPQSHIFLSLANKHKSLQNFAWSYSLPGCHPISPPLYCKASGKESSPRLLSLVHLILVSSPNSLLLANPMVGPLLY